MSGIQSRKVLSASMMAVCIVLGGAGASDAALLVGESFDYAPGAALNSGSLNGGIGWSGAWSGTDNIGADDQIEAATIVPPTGYLGQAGGQLLINTDSPSLNLSVTARRDLASGIDLNPASTQTYYVSFLFRRDDAFNGGGTENSRYFELRDSSNNVVVYAGTTSAEAADVSLNGFAGASSGTAGQVQLNVDTLGLVKLVLRPAGQNDEIYVTYLTDGDDLSSEPVSWMASASFDAGGVMTTVSVFAAGNTDLTRYDELRIGTEFSDVVPVPEPASACLLLAAGGLALFRRR